MEWRAKRKAQRSREAGEKNNEESSISNNSKDWSETGQPGGGTSTNQFVEMRAAVNMLVFLRTLYRYFSHGINSRSSPETFLSAQHRAAASLLRCCGDARRAIRWFCESGCRFPGERDLSARYVRATERRSGFCSCGFRESSAACTEEPRGTQLPGLGLARARRNRFRDRSFPDCGETESRFCIGAHEFFQRAGSERRRACCAQRGEGSRAARPGRLRNSSRSGARTRFFRGCRWRHWRVPAGARA